MIKEFIFFIWFYLISKLSVPMARRYLDQHVMPIKANAQTDKQLLVDVSVIIKNDVGTGIQRVVRAILMQLLSNPLEGYRVCPIFATRKHGYHYAHYEANLDSQLLLNSSQTGVVNVNHGDVFLGLDLAAHLLYLHKRELIQWKRLGVKIHFVVYDLLPVLYPQWFSSKTTEKFHKWLRLIAIFSDSLISISNTVKAELNNWLYQCYALPTDQIPIHTIPLGADIRSSSPSHGLPKNLGQLLNNLSNKETVLIVGTVEPRKGHDQVLIAFEKLWEQGHDINLVIVGKPGWKTESLQKTVRQHPQHQNHLYWFDNASDELLELLYQHCTGVIVAALAEGFGLPLVEAIYSQKPVLARDIPVFREIGKNCITLFANDHDICLAQDILAWITKIRHDQLPRYTHSNVYTWDESARQLLTKMRLIHSTIN